MRYRSLLALGLATALGGVPSIALAADAAVPEPSALDGSVMPIIAGAAAMSVAGIALLVRRRQLPGAGAVRTPAERAIQAADEEAIAAALQARLLRRARIWLDDDRGDEVGRSEPPRGTG